jgi:hypothetical protein
MSDTLSQSLLADGRMAVQFSAFKSPPGCVTLGWMGAGVKNMDVHRELVDKPVPLELLNRKGLRTKQVMGASSVCAKAGRSAQGFLPLILGSHVQATSTPHVDAKSLQGIIRSADAGAHSS